jgi:hypothetical protein
VRVVSVGSLLAKTKRYAQIDDVIKATQRCVVKTCILLLISRFVSEGACVIVGFTHIAGLCGFLRLTHRCASSKHDGI